MTVPMPALPDPNDLLMSGSGGPRSAKFNKLGDIVRGRILDQRTTQCVEFDAEGKPTGNKKFWPSGDPMLQIDYTLQTDERDPQDEDDTGVRILHAVPRMQPAIKQAVADAGAKGTAIGGEIAVQWSSGTGQGKGNPREYVAAYGPPQIDPGSLLGGGPAPTPTPQAPPLLGQSMAATVATSAQPLVPPAVVPTTTATSGSLLGAANGPAPVSASAPTGVDPTAWGALGDEQKRAVLAAMGLPAF